MLNQSFSYENFRILLDVENRKGRYIEERLFFDNDIFLRSRRISEKITNTNKEIIKEINRLNIIRDNSLKNYNALDELRTIKEELKIRREETLKEILTSIADKTDNDDYELKIKKGKIKWSNQLYIIEHTPENFFVTKQLQRNIYKTFKVKQASRNAIIDQLQILLNDGFPKIVIRTDISKFYESIPHKELLIKIEDNSLLSYPTKKIIRRVLNEYWNILVIDGIKSESDERVGIPRGIGFSAYLSELYLRGFDNKIKSLPNVTYYSRYVDDILIIITPQNRKEVKSKKSIINLIKSTLSNTTKLNINTSKTKIIELIKENRDRKKSQIYELSYLGYKFVISYTKKNEKVAGEIRQLISKDKLKIFMSDDKLKRYKNKIDTSFLNYNSGILKYSTAKNSTERMLMKRLKFLSCNLRLFRRKSNVFVGIYFSNEFLSDQLTDLIELDRYLMRKISALPVTTNVKLVRKLKNLSFVNGFTTRKMIRLETDTFENGKLLQIWKDL